MTLDDLLAIFHDHGGSAEAGIRAVVEALQDEGGRCGHLNWDDFDEILGDAGEKVAVKGSGITEHPDVTSPAIDFAAHLARQRAFSERTFGPGDRVEGVSDHIRKELLEVAKAEPGDERQAEWIDVVMLALDGAWRSGMSPEQIIQGLRDKLDKNERRTWPDWRTADPNKAIEHERATAPAPAVCEWRFDLERSVWRTGCGQYFGPFQAGDKEEAKRCHHCSAPIKFTEAKT